MSALTRGLQRRTLASLAAACSLLVKKKKKRKCITSNISQSVSWWNTFIKDNLSTGQDGAKDQESYDVTILSTNPLDFMYLCVVRYTHSSVI